MTRRGRVLPEEAEQRLLRMLEVRCARGDPWVTANEAADATGMSGLGLGPLMRQMAERGLLIEARAATRRDDLHGHAKVYRARPGLTCERCGGESADLTAGLCMERCFPAMTDEEVEAWEAR